jgi:hypothetical protein
MTMMRPGPGEIGGRTAAALVGGASAAVFLWLIATIVITDGGPHGYLLIFGGLFAFAAGLLAAFVLPLAFPSGRRLSALGVSLLALVAILVAAGVLLFR